VVPFEVALVLVRLLVLAMVRVRRRVRAPTLLLVRALRRVRITLAQVTATDNTAMVVPANAVAAAAEVARRVVDMDDHHRAITTTMARHHCRLIISNHHRSSSRPRSNTTAAVVLRHRQRAGRRHLHERSMANNRRHRRNIRRTNSQRRHSSSRSTAPRLLCKDMTHMQRTPVTRRLLNNNQRRSIRATVHHPRLCPSLVSMALLRRRQAMPIRHSNRPTLSSNSSRNSRNSQPATFRPNRPPAAATPASLQLIRPREPHMCLHRAQVATRRPQQRPLLPVALLLRTATRRHHPRRATHQLLRQRMGHHRLLRRSNRRRLHKATPRRRRRRMQAKATTALSSSSHLRRQAAPPRRPPVAIAMLVMVHLRPPVTLRAAALLLPRRQLVPIHRPRPQRTTTHPPLPRDNPRRRSRATRRRDMHRRQHSRGTPDTRRRRTKRVRTLRRSNRRAIPIHRPKRAATSSSRVIEDSSIFLRLLVHHCSCICIPVLNHLISFRRCLLFAFALAWLATSRQRGKTANSNRSDCMANRLQNVSIRLLR
jgi:hypothetical protein